MKVERNENPFDEFGGFDKSRPDNAPEARPPRGILVTKTHIALAAMSFLLVLIISVLVTVLLYNHYLRRLYPLPVNQNQYQIDYSFDDDHLIALADMNAKYVAEIQAGATRKGSGVIFKINDDGTSYILTNHHVIQDIPARDIQIKLFGAAGFTTGDDNVELLGYDEFNDIAVLRFRERLPAIYDSDGGIRLPSYVAVSGGSVKVEYAFERDFGAEQTARDQDMLVTGKRVLALGNALGQGMSACEGIISKPINYITKEIASTPNKIQYNNTVIQITAPINGGNSGGGLFDMKGQLIGINTYRARMNDGVVIDNISYTVPIELALSSAYHILNRYDGTVIAQAYDEATAFFNLGLTLDYEPATLGGQDNAVLRLKMGKTNITVWDTDDTPSSYAYPDDTGWTESVLGGRTRVNPVTEVAGIPFSGTAFDRLPLDGKKLLLLKAECTLYGYRRVSGEDGDLTLIQNGKTYTALNIKKI